MAYFGFKGSSLNYEGNISKKQFYARLKRLRDLGFIEKRDSYYRTTTFGSLIYNGQIKTLEDILANYWNLKAVDVLKSRQDFPLHQKENVIEEIIFNRYEAGLQFEYTHITTNLDADMIEKIYGERFIDRLREMCNVISIEGESFR